MTRQLLQILSVLILIFLGTQCAQIVPLTGGQKDVAPPKLLEAAPPVNSTNFKEDLITLTFNEFVQVKDLTNQLIITPRLNVTPEITADGKKIIVDRKKAELAPNTTYRIFFGKAIADMHESNSIPDFEYVFSTGDKIDTTKVKGDVTDAINNKPVADIMIALYFKEEKQDSVLYKTEPDYITRSDENGNFVLKNLPHRTFKAFAFSDKNKNSLYDGEVERVAFLDEDLTLLSDTMLHFKLFQEDAPKSFVKKTTMPYTGFAQFFLNKKAKVTLTALHAKDQQNISETQPGKEKDTISVYYKDITDTLSLSLHNLSINKTDTFKLVVPKLPAKRRLKTFTVNTIGSKLALYDKLSFTFLNWMDTTRTDLSKIKFTSKEDSTIAAVPLKGHWTSITSYVIDPPFKEGINYIMKVDTGAFFDLRNIANDSSQIAFTTQSKIEFGKLTLKMRFNKKQEYVVQLLNEQEKVVREQYVSIPLSSTSAVTLEFTDVLPGVYVAKVIFDDNKNRKWDTGNLLKKQQPEKVIINSKQLKVLSDWEIEEEILIKD